MRKPNFLSEEKISHRSRFCKKVNNEDMDLQQVALKLMFNLCSGFVPKMSFQDNFGIFFHWYLCRNRYIVCVEFEIMKSTQKKKFELPKFGCCRRCNKSFSGRRQAVKCIKFYTPCFFSKNMKEIIPS